jgi:hypothetical protein
MDVLLPEALESGGQCMSRRKQLRAILIGASTALLAVGSALGMSLLPAAGTVTGGVSTTDDTGFGFPYTAQACLNGIGVNCNIYLDKRDVFFSGLPVEASLGAGTYFFAVLEPGGQPNPNDLSYTLNDGDKNLSDDYDPWTNREFSVDSSGIFTYSGSHEHDTANNKISLFPYADTTNPGGVYIMSICKVPSSPTTVLPVPGVDPRDCKYDAFKVKVPTTTTTPPAADLTVVKDASASFNRTFSWSIAKSVDKTVVEQLGGTATFNYTVTVTNTGYTDSGWTVTGTITVFNPNVNTDGSGVQVTGVNVTDSINDPNATCSVTGGSDTTISGSGENSDAFPYTCAYSQAPANSAETNTATVHWPAQMLTFDSNSCSPAVTLCQSNLAEGSASFPFDFTFSSPTLVDNCVTVTDTFGLSGGTGTTSTLGAACVSPETWTTDPSNTLAGFAESDLGGVFTLTYSRTVSVPTFNCIFYTNTAVFTTKTSGTTGSASATVEVCGPAKTAALTMGFWQNKNGQGIISGGASTLAVCNSGTWLRMFNPFKDLSSTATCSQVASYVLGVIKNATCSTTTCNSMLKAQDLATSLDVYFSDPSLGGNKINAPAPIGGVSIDLTKICHMIDGTGGTATCSGSYENVQSAFITGSLETVPSACNNPSPGATSMTVICMLWNAASNSNSGGTSWYNQVKATQVLAKDAFDAINNQVAFSP